MVNIATLTRYFQNSYKCINLNFGINQRIIKMRSITYSKFGPASDVLTLQESPVPLPTSSEVLVKLHFSGVNPSDAKARGGTRPGVKKPAFSSVTPNSDGSGIIVSVGSKVDVKRIGERVWIWNGQWQRSSGTAADFISLPSEQAVKMPNKMSFATGACLGIPGLTAAHCALGDGSLFEKVVLVSGGAGSVGHTAIQLAKWSGAKVIATGSPSGFERILSAGADHALDYSDPQLSKKILNLAPDGVDRVIEVEFGQNIDLLHQVTRSNGTISVYGSTKNMTPILPFGSFLFKAIKIDIVLIYILSDKARGVAIKALHDAYNSSAFNPVVEKIYDLTDCASAHDATLRSNRNGAVLLKIH
jgi:NADPH2:quinone reductase